MATSSGESSRKSTHNYEVKESNKWTKRRGKCLIINNIFDSVKAKSHPPKNVCEATIVDADDIEDVWKQLVTNVKRYDNLTTKEMAKLLDDEKIECEGQECDIFVCYILTHGLRHQTTGNEIVFGTDSEPLGLESLLSLYNNVNCSSMTHKPKMFVIETCQGTLKHDEPAPPLPKEIRVSQAAGPTIPTSTDFLVCICTQDNYDCYKHNKPEDGSYYIQTQLKSICDSAQNQDILSIMLKARSMMKEQLGETKIPTEERTTLTKRLFLNPEIHEIDAY